MLSLSFDLGHSSIGWCVLDSAKHHPEILGTGVVTFPADDCLASQRRGLRRTRRHIRSTRQRIERLKKWLAHQSALSREDLDLPGHAAPFLLAAAALAGTRKLTALELWNCLRWYAHNRGYDGNARWSRQEEDDAEDTEKVKNANSQLAKHGTSSMAATICKILDLDPAHPNQKISSFLPYKTLNTAYPRHIVTEEVRQLLALHQNIIPGLDKTTITLIFPDRDLTKKERTLLAAADIKLPKRYHGGLLFGQLVPRFDNRIISRCPITWAKIYKEELAKGSEEKEARRLAERNAKVPTKRSEEFLHYRFARILANLKADGDPIGRQTRQKIYQLGKDRGRLTATDLHKILSEDYPDAKTNVSSYFQLHPDSGEALVLDPAMEALTKASKTGRTLKPFWKYLPESADAEAVDLWREGGTIDLHWIIARATDPEDLESEIEKAFNKARKNHPSIESFCSQTKIKAVWPSGRAPFTRPVMRQVVDEILAGHDAIKPSLKTNPKIGEDKEQDGVLYQFSVPDSEVNQLLQKRPLDKLTNNHLVRHRLLILERLVDELIQEFAPDAPRKINSITVEVTRELKELSGKTAKEVSSELNSRLRDFKTAVIHLEKFSPHLPLTGGLIRKCRIAIDLDWRCPFTGEKFDAIDLPKLEYEHIIPFSARKTNALHALVLTFPEVNRMKGNTTALKFIQDHGGEHVRDQERLQLFTEKPFLKFVEKLNTKGHPDDQKRKRARKALLQIAHFEEREQSFTERELTQSSHLIKLAMRSLKSKLPHAQLHSIPGIATGEIRKSWNLLGCLGHPEVCGNEAMRWIERRNRMTGALLTDDSDQYPTLTPAPADDKKALKTAIPCPNDDCETPLLWPAQHSISQSQCPKCRAILRRVPKPKDEIRSLTHLHHSLDAVTLALITHYFPLTQHGQNQSGLIWKAVISRNKSPEEQELLRRTKLFLEKDEPRTKPDGSNVTRRKFYLQPLPNSVKEQLTKHLSLGRVAQHVPANRSGAKAELMTWGVTSIQGEGDDARITLQQSTSVIEKDRRKRTTKTREERAGKLLGPNPKNSKGKLADIKGALIIGENFALALDPKPQVIPFHQVSEHLEEIKQSNAGKMPRLLRNGMLIRLHKNPPRSQQDYTGIWRISSIKNSKGKFLLDLIRPSYITAQNGVTWSGMNKTLEPLLDCGLEPLPQTYSGHSKINLD